jgi:hypothetical protein
MAAHGWACCSRCAEALPLILVPLAKKGKREVKALRKTGVTRAPHSASVRGHRLGSAKAMADQVLIDVGAGASDELPLVIKQSFKDGRYSPLTRIEEIEWQIMLEQFVASGVVVKDEIINIDSDCDLLIIWCLRSFVYFSTFVLVARLHYLWQGASFHSIGGSETRICG